jgi:hypothetical protein
VHGPGGRVPHTLPTNHQPDRVLLDVARIGTQEIGDVQAALMPDGSASAPAWLWVASFPCRQLHPALGKPVICRLRPNLIRIVLCR